MVHSEVYLNKYVVSERRSRPVESQIGARGMTLTGPHAGCLTHE